MARRVLVDVNVVLDVAIARDPHHQSSQIVLSLIDQGKLEGYFSATSFSTVYYLLKKEMHPDDAMDYIRTLMGLLRVAQVNKSVLERALSLRIEDFEDAIQAACAERCKAELILTRDRSGYKDSKIKALTPSEFLATFT